MEALKRIECPTCTNENCFIKRHCSPEWLTNISNNKSSSRYKKGKTIFLERGHVMGVYFIYAGKVKITISSTNGKEQIVRLARDGHILGHRGYGGEKYAIGSMAIEESIICFVNNEVMYEACFANPLFTFNLMMFYSKELRKSEQRIKFLAQMTVREKTAYALIYLLDTFGIDRRSKALKISLTRREIGSIVGLNADQISRILTDFKKEKILMTEGKIIRLTDTKKLLKLVKKYMS